MDLTDIVTIGKNEYFITEFNKLLALSTFAIPGSKVYCTETEKTYICVDANKWVSM